MRALSWISFALFAAAGILTAIFALVSASLVVGDPEFDAVHAGIFWSTIAAVIFGSLQRVFDSGVVRSSKKVLKDQRARLFEIFGDGPILRLLRLVDEMAGLPVPSRATKIEAIRQSVIRAACEIVDADRPRASYFQVEDLSAKSRVMSCQATMNYAIRRTDDATSQFVEHSGQDIAVWAVLDGTLGPRLEPDILKKRPADLSAANGRVYRCFITIRVQVSDVGIGLLTINALEANELGRADLSILRSLAELLSLAETVALGTASVKSLTGKNAIRLSRLS